MKLRHLTRALSVALILSFAPLALAQVPDDTKDASNIHGLWLVESGNGKVMVKDCGDGTPCGTLFWLDASKVESLLDVNNTDPEKRTRPLLGTPVFWNFKEKNGKWKSGKIYDGESGKTYKSKMEILDDETLKVKGCIGPICRSEIWTKVPVK